MVPSVCVENMMVSSVCVENMMVPSVCGEHDGAKCVWRTPQ